MAPSAISRWYQKVADFNVETLFIRKRPPGPPRSVFINENLPEDYFDQKHRPKQEHIYTSNQVITSKYTIITFLPRNLLEQFRRVANVCVSCFYFILFPPLIFHASAPSFFLGIAILQFFNKFSTISPGLVILPLLIVLGITAIKDAYEDIKRHQSDRRVNHSHIRVMSGGDWVNPNVMANKSRTFVRGIVPMTSHKKVKKVKVDKTAIPDDVEMQVHRGTSLTGDTLTPHDHGIEYDDDKFLNEQGESHLFGHEKPHRPHWKKTLWEDVRVGDFVKIMDNDSLPADILICATSEDENVAFVETKNLDGETNLKSRNAVPALTQLRTAMDCANKVNRFEIDCDRPDTNMYKLNGTIRANDEKYPVDLQMTLLRGTVLRNTGWVIGIVLFTGQDTKIVMNSGGTPSKRSKVERQMNPQVYVLYLCDAKTLIVADLIY
jgi:phospholipid-translocating ATPase